MNATKKVILVTGGLGYIGSHTIVELFNKDYLSSVGLNDDYEIVIVDNCSNSKEKVLSILEGMTKQKITLYKTDIINVYELEDIFKKHNFYAVIHFAAKKSIGESIQHPLEYYENNVCGTINLINMCLKYNCHNFIFSSSCSVYGNNAKNSKETEKNLFPLNPYARTKLTMENILIDIAAVKENNFNVVILRYCNPVSAHKSGILGEDPISQHKMLFPIITEHILGKREKIFILGNDYNTPDGTCQRDYFHIMDLAQCHCLVLKCFDEKKCLLHNNYTIYNVGSNKGYSVKEILDMFSVVSGKKLNFEFKPRRTGDAEAVYLNCDKIKEELNWVTQKTLKEMCEDDLNFVYKHPNGY